MSKIGFARVSTIEQDLTLQLQALEAAGCERIFSDKQSGKSEQNDKKLAEMIDYIRDGDVVYVTKLDRLGRSLKSILHTLDSIHGKGASLCTLDCSIDTSKKSPFSEAMISLMGVFAQLERDLIVSRTTEGRAAAMLKGKRMGRKFALDEKAIEQIKKRLAAGETQSALAREFGVARTSIRRYGKRK